LRTAHFMDTSKRLLFRADIDELRAQMQAGVDPAAFELAGPREQIYFNPGELRCGIVTCGGLCPGLNDVIRSIVFCLQEKYGVTAVYGFRFGYAGLAEPDALKPIELTTRRVGQINEVGGTVLGSSRGPQPVDEMVDTLERLGIQLLFTVGGDGTPPGGGFDRGRDPAPQARYRRGWCTQDNRQRHLLYRHVFRIRHCGRGGTPG